MMITYKIATEGGIVYVRANLSEASSPIYTYFGDDPDKHRAGENEEWRWSPTPFQTADAQHIERRMARLVAEYCDLGEVHSIAIV